MAPCCDATYLWLYNGVTPAEDSWNLDTKVDDGKPFTGKVQISTSDACFTGSGSTATYNLSGTGTCTVLQNLGY